MSRCGSMSSVLVGISRWVYVGEGGWKEKEKRGRGEGRGGLLVFMRVMGKGRLGGDLRDEGLRHEG